MTDRYAVVGNPVAHSRSPRIHAEFARQTGEDIAYAAILAPLDGFAATVAQFRAEGGKGLNVTVPFKQEAYTISTECSIRARSARAANTLAFIPRGIYGDNTDGAGLVNDLKNNLRLDIRGKRILLMGAGGAARGVLLPLLLEEPSGAVLVNRTLSRAQALRTELAEESQAAELMGAGKAPTRLEVLDYAHLSGCGSFDLVINATSSSLAGELPPLPAGIFAPAAVAYDMMYGRGLTPFLRYAREQGAATLADGLGMLVEQAAESFLLWRGVRPHTAPVIALLRSEP